MLDRKFIAENAEKVQQNCTHRGMKVDIDRYVELERLRKSRKAEIDELNRRAANPGVAGRPAGQPGYPVQK